MSDIFREVEEDVRKERFQKFWKAWGNYVIAAAVLLFVGIGAWQLWERHDRQERERVATAFMAAQRITNPQAAANAFVDAADGAPKGYGEVARLAQANAMFAAGQRKEAIEVYKDIANGDRGPAGSVARLRAAWGIADTATRKELADLLAPINQPGSAWSQNAREVLAYADYRALDLKAAQAKYEALAADTDAPDALKARAKAMAAYLKGGGAITFGSVPPQAIALPPAAAPAPAAP